MKALDILVQYIGIPGTTVVGVIIAYAVVQLIGELIELGGKVVPEFFKIRKFFKRKKEEKKQQEQLMLDMKKVIEDFNARYSTDNIGKRNDWMHCVDDDRQWMHERAQVYDKAIIEITEALNNATQQLLENTNMTIDMFVESSRDRIIDFAEKAANYDCILSREQFRRIDRVYNDYEAFLEEHGRLNGEVDTAYELIQDGYKYRIRNHCFLEDLKGFTGRK